MPPNEVRIGIANGKRTVEIPIISPFCGTVKCGMTRMFPDHGVLFVRRWRQGGTPKKTENTVRKIATYCVMPPSVSEDWHRKREVVGRNSIHFSFRRTKKCGMTQNILQSAGLRGPQPPDSGGPLFAHRSFTRPRRLRPECNPQARKARAHTPSPAKKNARLTMPARPAHPRTPQNPCPSVPRTPQARKTHTHRPATRKKNAPPPRKENSPLFAKPQPAAREKRPTLRKENTLPPRIRRQPFRRRCTPLSEAIFSPLFGAQYGRKCRFRHKRNAIRSLFILTDYLHYMQQKLHFIRGGAF